MKTILHIDSSILGEHSVSRALTSDIVARLQARHPGSQVLRRDVATDEVMRLSTAHLAVLQGSPAASEETA